MPHRLVTIPISHYCEKARWALDRAGVVYEERRHVQLVHVLMARRSGGGITVPVLVTDTGDVLRESADIMRWADVHLAPERRLYAAGGEEEALAQDLDDRFGPAGRLWMYEQTLPVIREMRPWALAGVPRWERAAFRVGAPVANLGIRRYLGVDAGSSAAALREVEATFDAIAARLADGRRFLFGDRFGAADLTFAALAAPTILPSRYGSPLPPVAAMPEGYARHVARLRAHPAGRFAARLYDEER